MQLETPLEAFDLTGMVADLNGLLRLKTTVVGIKMFARAEDMMAIPKIRRPSAVHTTDQIVSMASRLGWTVGITGEDLVGAQCRAVIGLDGGSTSSKAVLMREDGELLRKAYTLSKGNPIKDAKDLLA